jgi:beta-glucosidase
MASLKSKDDLGTNTSTPPYSDDEQDVENERSDEAQHLMPKDGDMELEFRLDKPKTLGQRLCPAWCPAFMVPSRLFCWLSGLFALTVCLLLLTNMWFYPASATLDGLSPPWYPTPLGGTAKEWAESYNKAAKLVSQMTLVEKVNITTGTGWMMGLCVGNTGPVPRLGFPSLCLQDGPLGIRFADNITAFPAGITVGATWNRALMYRRGKALGAEFRLKGVNVMLGPVMGPVGRSPLGGRNWEAFGSDPVLQAIASAETVKGIQSEGVIATVKHFVGNEQEHFRQAREWFTQDAISSNIDDRTLHEIYAWPFQDTVRAGVGSVMCSYNQVNNSYGCQNSKLLNGILKDEFGFQGFVQSDWLAQRSGVASALAGLDMDMPGDGLRWQDGKSLWGKHLTTAVLNGSVPLWRINDMATRIVATWYQLGQDDKKWSDGPNFSSWTNDRIGLIHAGSDDKTTAVVNKFVNVQGEGADSHGAVARHVAAEGIVLLKNQDNYLPLTRNGWPKGRSKPTPTSRFCVGIYGTDAFSDPKGPNSCVDRACNPWTLGSGWGSGAAEFPYLVSPFEAIKSTFDKSVEIFEFRTNTLSIKQLDSLRRQDLCIAFINADAGEGYKAIGALKGDRNDLLAQNGGNELAELVASQCGGGSGDVVVVIHSVGPVLMEGFVDRPNVKAVLFANLPGQESGNALTDVLFGEVNPSGHLPFTIGKSMADYGPSAEIMTHLKPKQPIPQQDFSEGLLIDYRHFDHFNIEPRYEFGYGLSYTTFNLSRLSLKLLKPKTRLPNPRPPPASQPPSYDAKVPDPTSALFPPRFRQLRKYVYPYISSTRGITFHESPQPPPSPLSPAGGGPGGNPSLFDDIVTVKAIITNTGKLAGSVVVQVYVSLPQNYVDEDTGEHIFFPVRTLRNFQKIQLNETATPVPVEMNLTRRDLSYWSSVHGNWVMPTTGKIKVAVGFSSRDLPLSKEF